MKDINGVLSVSTKVWFNDKARCRLRICGFTNSQIKEMKRFELTDITMQPTGEPEKMIAFISISKLIPKPTKVKP